MAESDQVEAKLRAENQENQHHQHDHREGERPGKNIEPGNRGIVERAFDDKTGNPKRGVSPEFS